MTSGFSQIIEKDFPSNFSSILAKATQDDADSCPLAEASGNS